MKKVCFLILLLCLSSILFSQSYITEDMKAEVMPVSEISPGMTGYGLTVFHDTTIEKFNFKVIGIIKEGNRGRDLIYVELDHPRINRTNTGVIQGMSGSPCYINDKLVGAVAYGWGFSKENVCMLTPIMDMFETFDPKAYRNTEATAPSEKNNALAIPLSISGLTPATENFIKDHFKQRGFSVYSGGGKSTDKINMPGADKATLKPGAAIGAVLMDGDITAVGTGTVTYAKGDKLLAFGHPMDEIGYTDVPMCTAYVLDVFSSYEVSRKISNPLDIKGAVFMDSSFAIAGEMGKEAKMSPVHVHIKDTTTGREENLNCRVPSQSVYFYDMAPMAVLEGYNRTRVEQAPTFGKFTYSIELENGSKYSFTNYYTNQYSILFDVFAQFYGLTDKLTTSKYGIQKIKSIDVEGEICDGNKEAYIERVFLNKNTFKPGEEIQIGIVMRKYADKDTFTEFKTVKIPEEAEPGRLAMLIYGGSLSESISLASKEGQGNRVMSLFADRDNTTSFDQYFKNYLKFEKNNELVVSLISDKGTTLVASGEKLTDLPEYMKMLFSNTNNSVITGEPVEYKSVFKEDIIPMGLATLSVPVELEIKASVLDNSAKPLINVVNPQDIKKAFSHKNKWDTTPQKPLPSLVSLIDELDEALKVTAKDVSENNIPTTLPAEGAENATQETKTEGKKEEAKTPAPPAKIKTSIKQPLLLEYKEIKDFNSGMYKNCNYGNDQILPTVEFLKNISLEEQLATTIAKTKRGYVVGCGLKSGIVFFNEKKPGALIPLEGLWVSSICEVGNDIFVAVNPDSMVYKVKGDTCEKLFFNSKHKYISAMMPLGDNILMGFSDSDEILLLDKNFKVLKKTNHKSVFTTCFAKYKDKIYAGTKNQIISLDGDLNVQTLVNNPGGVITTMSVNSKGEIYAFIATKNIIIKKDDTGINKVVPKCGEMFASYIDNTDTAYFVGRDVITKVYKNGDYVSDKYTDVAAQFSAIIPTGEGEAYITSTNPGNVFKIALHPKECVYTSANLDLGEIAKLKDIVIPMNCEEILVGSTLKDAKPFGEVDKIKDFKIFVRFNENYQGKFNKITLKYFMPNRVPIVKVAGINTNDVIKGKKKLEFTITDLDKDNYTVKVFARGNGADYKQLYPSDTQKEEKDKEPIKSFEIDTTTLTDGFYDFKVEADDSLSNPGKGKVGVWEVKSVQIKNTAPTISADNLEIKVKEGETVVITGKASGRDLLGVEYSLGGPYKQTGLINGTFTIELNGLPKGENKISVRAVDEEENYSAIEVKVVVE